MTISFSGLASGLDTSSWVEALVSVKQEKVTTLQTELNALNTKKSTLTSTKSSFSSFRSALEKLTDAKFGGTFNLFDKNTAKSSNEEIFTATADSSALRENYDISVLQLATYTKASSISSVSGVGDDETLLSALGITNGTLSVYVNGHEHTVTIEDDDKLGDLKDDFNGMDLNLTVDDDGMVSISAINEDDEVVLGANIDTSNMMSALGLSKNENGEYVSSRAIFKADISASLTSESAGFNQLVTAGTFTIGGAEFTVDENTTLSNLIYEINHNDLAQVKASWDSATGKLNLTSKKEGATSIYIAAGSSNFTDVMGFTSTERDEENNIISTSMYTSNQELGQNAKFTINGTTLISTSNTVQSDISNLEGVTLTLKKVSSEEDGTTTLSVTQDTTDLVEAVKNFVSEYNSIMEKIEEVTASGADLERESSLTSFRNTMRNYASSMNTTNGGAFSLLSEIGISTAKADGDTLADDVTSLTLDESKLIEALNSDSASVEALLTDENGILNMMEDSVELMLTASSGFFSIKEDTLNSDIENYEDKITKQQEKVDRYQTQLENKFNNMELMITQMQQNYSSFLSS